MFNIIQQTGYKNTQIYPAEVTLVYHQIKVNNLPGIVYEPDGKFNYQILWVEELNTWTWSRNWLSDMVLVALSYSTSPYFTIKIPNSIWCHFLFQIQVVVKWELHDQDDKVVYCWQIPARIVN